MPFAGYIVSDEGVRPDPARVVSLKNFPVPKDQTGVKSFMGLANQLTMFIPDYAQITKSLRELMGKGQVFRWLPEHQFEFEHLKRVLSESLLNHHFDQSKEVHLMTDASRQYGLGFALCQYVNEKPVIIMCGSKSLTPTQQRYATVELECLGIVWAIQKCDFYLRGLPSFTVLTDHRPLEGVFQKTIFEQGNPRLQRMREKLTAYTFIVKWVRGKDHFIADALSRAPVFPPDEDIDLKVDTALTCLIATSDPALKIVTDSIDSDYTALARDIAAGTCVSPMFPFYKALRDRLSVVDNLILLDSTRIVLPKGCIKSVIQRLHEGHPGQEKTLRLASGLFYWPGQTNDIKTSVSSCQECFRKLPSQKHNPLITEPPSKAFGAPMAHVGVDLFDVAGKSYLICVDKWSGYPVFKQLRSTTSATIINVLYSWFNLLGWPKSIRSDGGPQFLSEFKSWCEKNNINHEVSSPYNPKANGLAESAVKNVKHLILKCKNTGEDPEKSLYVWRNIPRADGYSPAQLLFGRRQFTALPAVSQAYDFYDVQEAQKCRDKVFNSHIPSHDQGTGFLSDLSPGDRVVFQHPKTGDWSQRGVIISVRPSGQSYQVESDGRIYTRSRQFLRTDNCNSAAADQCTSLTASLSSPDHSFSDRQSDSLSNKQESSWDLQTPSLKVNSMTRRSSSPAAKTPVIHNQTKTGLWTNRVLQPCSSGTGHHLGAVLPQLSCASPSASSFSFSSERTTAPIPDLGGPSSMNCCSLPGVDIMSVPVNDASPGFIRQVQDIPALPSDIPVGVMSLPHLTQQWPRQLPAVPQPCPCHPSVYGISGGHLQPSYRCHPPFRCPPAWLAERSVHSLRLRWCSFLRRGYLHACPCRTPAAVGRLSRATIVSPVFLW